MVQRWKVFLDGMGQVHQTVCNDVDRVSYSHQVHLGVSWEHITVCAYWIWLAAPVRCHGYNVLKSTQYDCIAAGW